MSKKILIIDDSALMRRVISDIIKSGNEYEVAAIAKDGLEGYEYIRQNPTLYSAVILDINMPKMNGIEFLKIIKSDPNFKTIPVVILTTSNDENDKFICYSYGAAGYIIKPIDYNEFQEAIKTFNNYWNINQFVS